MYNLLIVPFLALIIAQMVKMVIDARNKKFSWNDFNSYGGMPSSHAAMVSALVVEAAQTQGIASPIFAISLILAFIVLRDAVGFRYKLGGHAKILNMLITDLPDKEEAKYPHLEERLGHTYKQAIVGMLIGIALAFFIGVL